MSARVARTLLANLRFGIEAQTDAVAGFLEP